jgi:hypothetical protein
MTEWKIQHSRVYGDGKSFNVNNKVTAVELQSTLNNYEDQIQTFEDTQYTLEQANKQLIEIKMTLSILQADIDKLKEVLKC